MINNFQSIKCDTYVSKQHNSSCDMNIIQALMLNWTVTVTDVHFAATFECDWNHLFHKYPFFKWTEAPKILPLKKSSLVYVRALTLLFFPPHTVCNGHHRTEVHLAGHRLPGALLTDSQTADSHSAHQRDPRLFWCRPPDKEPQRGHWRLGSIP